MSGESVGAAWPEALGELPPPTLLIMKKRGFRGRSGPGSGGLSGGGSPPTTGHTGDRGAFAPRSPQLGGLSGPPGPPLFLKHARTGLSGKRGGAGGRLPPEALRNRP